MSIFGNYDGTTVITLAAAHVAQDIILEGGQVAALFAGGAIGDKVAARVHGKLVGVAKAGSQVWARGATLYWDDTAKNFTTTSSGNTKCGWAAAAALSADVTGDVVIVPIP